MEFILPLLVLILLHFIPVGIAANRQHNATMSIFISMVVVDVLFLLGFLVGLWITIPGWVILWFVFLIWSLNSNTRKKDMRRAELIALAMRQGASQ